MVNPTNKKWLLFFVIAVSMLFVATTASTSTFQKSAQPMNVNKSSVSLNASGAVSTEETSTPRQVGGDSLPVEVDPQQPASCALVTKGEDDCSACCLQVFTEGSEKFTTCSNACTRAEAAKNEH